MKTYTYNGIVGVLLDNDNEKICGVNPMEKGLNRSFFSLDSLTDIDIEDGDARVTYDEEYNGEFDDNEVPITYTEVANIGNRQKLIREWVTEDYADDDEYEREMLTLTDEHYEWTSELSKLANALRDAYYPNMDVNALREAQERLRPEWNALCGKMEMKRGEYTDEALPIAGVVEKYVL